MRRHARWLCLALGAGATSPGSAAVAQRAAPRVSPERVAARVVATVNLDAAYSRPLEAAITRLAAPPRPGSRDGDTGLTCTTSTARARLVDLNRDSVPEVELTAAGPCVYPGPGRERVWVFARRADTGAWSPVLAEYTTFVPLRTRQDGYVDVLSQPGTAVVVWRWNGREYRALCEESNFGGNTCPAGLPGPFGGDSLPPFVAGSSTVGAGDTVAESGLPADQVEAAAALFASVTLADSDRAVLTLELARLLGENLVGPVSPANCQARPVVARLVSLDDDATPEVELRVNNGCRGTHNGQQSWLYGRPAGGPWALLLEGYGPLRALDTRAGRYRDVAMGARAYGQVPVVRWSGKGYGYYCTIYPPGFLMPTRACPARMAGRMADLPAFTAAATATPVPASAVAPSAASPGVVSPGTPTLSPRFYPNKVERSGRRFRRREAFNFLNTRLPFDSYRSRDPYLVLRLNRGDALPDGLVVYVEGFPIGPDGKSPDILDGPHGRTLPVEGKFRLRGEQTLEAAGKHPHGTYWLLWVPPDQGLRPDALRGVELIAEYNPAPPSRR